MPYMPNVGDSIVLQGTQFKVPPAYPGGSVPFEFEGGKAIVYKLQSTIDGSLVALKAFNYAFRNADQVKAVKRLHSVQHLPGLQAARQTIILPTDPIVREHEELAWAVMMPWIEGTTWGAVLGELRSDGVVYSRAEAEATAMRLAARLAALEKLGHVHCDLSTGNAVRKPGKNGEFELIDLEDMVINGAADGPSGETPGTLGYQMHGVRSTAVREGDRYAAAIIIAEALCLSCEHAANFATTDGMFSGNRTNPKAQQTFDYLYRDLLTWKPAFAKAFHAAWNAKSLADCPRIQELLSSLSAVPPIITNKGDVPTGSKRPFDKPMPVIPGLKAGSASGQSSAPTSDGQAPSPGPNPPPGPPPIRQSIFDQQAQQSATKINSGGQKAPPAPVQINTPKVNTTPVPATAGSTKKPSGPGANDSEILNVIRAIPPWCWFVLAVFSPAMLTSFGPNIRPFTIPVVLLMLGGAYLSDSLNKKS